MPSLLCVGLGQWSFEIVAEGGGWLRFCVRVGARILALSWGFFEVGYGVFGVGVIK